MYKTKNIFLKMKKILALKKGESGRFCRLKDLEYKNVPRPQDAEGAESVKDIRG